MTREPKVSALIITYNHGRYVRAALESVLAQETSFAVEIVIADDASTDETRAVIAEVALQHPDRVRLSLLEENVGDGGIQNTLSGLALCRGEYIAMLDGDDYWTDSGKLQRQADFLDAHAECAMCFHNCTIEYEAAERRSWNTTRPTGRETVTTEDLLVNAMVQMSTIMMRKNVALELRKWPDLLTDWFIGLVASRTGPVGYIDRVMSAFRQHERSYFTSLGRAGQWVKFIQFYEQLEPVLGEAHREAIERAICERAYLAAMEYEKERDLKNAGAMLSRALAGKPEWLESYSISYGLNGDEFFRLLQRRLELYRRPFLLRSRLMLGRVREDLRWRWLAITLRVSSHLRISRHEPIGMMLASPNPVRALSSPGRAGVALVWTSSTEVVEVRVGRPDGPLVSRTIATGSTQTGEWISDGTVFFLQNVLGNLPLVLENTLAVVRVRVKG